MNSCIKKYEFIYPVTYEFINLAQCTGSGGGVVVE
jgi:hypothetical protein